MMDTRRFAVAKKVGMTQVFDEKTGSRIPVTVLQLEPMTVTAVRTDASNGYTAVQIGYVPAKEKHLNKPLLGFFNKIGVAPKRHLKEFRLPAEAVASYQVGQEIDPNTLLEEGALVDITGKSIGKGFRSAKQRFGHGRGPMSHGSKSHRLPGSIGAGTTPGRVFRLMEMAGNTGNETVSQKRLKVVRTFPEKNLVLVRGSVPGYDTQLVVLRFS